ncbi:pollen-specific leucine-rich repeat extensin-like protein 2 isoform X3 [Coccinella septempunctata]|uniref:pollen-specific leucine-rich repeat extensin-like protein 2 isoform X3 n=1 Tax=Coccinella septempunctata TaxID=41139 RepID=UPI001D06192D|nr:pollen-specific leucine-rich repeat extensin-like protein 2 isoform X3 [Coccinella septempunctata]
MSVPNQPNGKKSSNSSIANTPASTPVTSSNGNAQAVIHNSPPPNNNAPKYGTLVPNRIFVGGISANTTEGELLQLFSSYGTVKAAKIIQDRAGVSKGYGFITFESEDDAQRPLREADNIVLRERKLNIAPAVKKQLSFPQPFNFNRAYDGSSPTTVAVGNPQYFLPPTMPYFQGSVGYYAPPPNAPVPGDPNAQQPVYQPPPVYPAQTGPPQAASYPSMMFPAQTIYMPQQYSMAMPYEYGYYTNNGAPAQYMVGAQGGPGPQGPPLPPSGSPPRPPCYNQQVSYTSEPVFYNMPMYSGPIDHPPVYTEPIETSGNYTEEPYMGQCVQQDIDARYSARGTPCDSTTPVGDHPLQQNNVPSSTPARYTPYADQQPPQQQQQYAQPPPLANDNEAVARQSNTPVVSLLAIDHSAEKDFNAMQGGRRKKAFPVPPSAPPPNALFAAQLMNGMPFPPINFPPPPLNYHPPPPYGPPPPFAPFVHAAQPFNNGYGPHPPHHHHHQQQQQQSAVRPAAQTNGYAKRQGPRRNYNNRQNNYSNRSSLRTDSSSSAASCVEDTKQQHRTNVNTPPPAPYSPLTNHGFTSRFNGVTTPPIGGGQYNGNINHVRPARNNYYNNNNNGRTSTKPRTNNYPTQRTSNNARENVNEMTNNHRGDANQTNKIHDTNAPQVHGGSGGASTNNYAPLPTRRNRRSLRRTNVGTGTALSEIGAGDAPLPQNPDSVSEACKKLDSLKL